LNRTTQSRTICKPTPPIRAAEVQVPPSYISANAKSRRAWFEIFVARASRRNAAPSKSSR